MPTGIQMNAANNYGQIIGSVQGNNIVNHYHNDQHVNYDRFVSALRSTNSWVDTSIVQRDKGNRAPETCEWLPKRKEYKTWMKARTTQALLLTGGPGTGKTFMSLYLVKELHKIKGATVLYYFCDNGDQRRNTGEAILRGLLEQLLQKERKLFRHAKAYINADFLNNLDNMWSVIHKMISDSEIAKCFILIDGLDECEKESRIRLITLLGVALDQSLTESKYLLTSRPDRGINEGIPFSHVQAVKIGPQDIRADLSKFIRVKTSELAAKKGYPETLAKSVESSFIEKADGTFLWVSLVIHDLSHTETENAEAVHRILSTLPRSLYEAYERILDRIQGDKAKFIIQLVTAAHRPLRIDELDAAYAVHTLNSSEIWRGIYKECEPLLYVNEVHGTVGLIHQTARDYLLDRSSKHYFDLSESNCTAFLVCLKYLNVEKFQDKVVRCTVDKRLAPVRGREKKFKEYTLLGYSWGSILTHALAINQTSLDRLLLQSPDLATPSFMTDLLLLSAVRFGQNKVVRILLHHHARVDAWDFWGQGPLHIAVFCGYQDIIRTLASDRAAINARDIIGSTPLHWAAKFGTEDTISHLLTSGADIEALDKHGGTPLAWAITTHHWAKDTQEAVAALLSHGANTDFVFKPWYFYPFDGDSVFLLESVRVAAKRHEGWRGIIIMEFQDIIGRVAELEDARYRGIYRTILRLRSQKGLVGAISKGVAYYYGRLAPKSVRVTKVIERNTTPLLYAMKFRPLDIVKLLLDNGASVEFVAQANAEHLSAVLAHKDEELTKIIGENFRGKYGLRAGLLYHIDSIYWRIANISM